MSINEQNRYSAAIYERFTSDLSFKKIAPRHSLSETRLNMAYYAYLDTQLTAEPPEPEDFQLIVRPRRRQMALTLEEEYLILCVADYYIKIGHPLTRTEIADMVKDVVSLLPEYRKQNAPFEDYQHYFHWLTCFVKPPPEYKMTKPGQAESERVTAHTTEAIAAQICLLNDLIQWYGINHPGQVTNLDQSGVSFKLSSKNQKGKYSASGREKV